MTSGPPEVEAAFSALLDRHAAWLGCRTVRHGHLTWLGGGDAAGPWFEAEDGTTRAALFEPPTVATFSTDTPVRWEACSESVRIDVPLVTPEQVYYVEHERLFVAGNDLRPLAAWAGFEPDPHSAAAFMQYGMVPAPMTLIRGVSRVPNGFSLTYRGGSNASVRRETPPIAEWTAPTDVESTPGKLDRALKTTPSGAVVFFSGGTDSGLIAARLSALGRTDVQLVNYAFGEDDDDSRAAEKLAGSLGLPFHRIRHDDAGLPDLFDRIGADSIFPFNDLSVIPTHRMLHASRELLTAGGAALLGVGADDIYDGGLKIRSWDDVYRVPRFLRGLAVGLLALTRPWWRDDRSRRVWGILRRSLSSRHPLGPLLMHNDLAGIGYPYGGVQRRIDAAWNEVYDPFTEGLSPEGRLSFAYLLNGGMGWEAPKFDPLRRFGVRSLYPFLDGEMLPHGFSLDWDQKCEGTKDKVLLKKLLRDSVPGGLEQRPKRGFSPPYERLLGNSDVQERMRAVLLDTDAPFAACYDAGFLRRALDRGRAGMTPNRGVMNLIWAAFFASSWLAQSRAALSRRPPDPAG